MNWTLALSKKGTLKLFAEYKTAVIKHLLANTEKGQGSGKVWQALQDQGIEVSRSSVIFFLTFMVDEGLCTFTNTTGKGGHHRLYTLAHDWEGVKRHLKIRIIEGLGEALEDDVSNLLEVL